MISLQRLEGFYWVARTEGYARAARAFPYPITQPGVHQQVRRLEEDLGCRLFERVGKDRVKPTAAGRALYEFVAPFLEGLKDVEAALTSKSFGGCLRVQTASLHLKQLIPAWARRLSRARPDITLDLKLNRRSDAEVLIAGEADLLIDYLPHPPRGVATREVGHTYGFLAIPSGHRLAGKARVELDDCQDDAFVLYSEDIGARALQLHAMREAHLAPEKTFSADSADAILGFVAAGLGVALVPWPSEQGPRVPGVVAHRLKHADAKFPIHAAWRSARAPNPLIEAALAVF